MSFVARKLSQLQDTQGLKDNTPAKAFRDVKLTEAKKLRDRLIAEKKIFIVTQSDKYACPRCSLLLVYNGEEEPVSLKDYYCRGCAYCYRTNTDLPPLPNF